MPKALERKLKSDARKKGLFPKSDKFGAYVYGSMRKMGWTPAKHKGKRGNR